MSPMVLLSPTKWSFSRLKNENQIKWARCMRLVSVSSKTRHNKFWDYAKRPTWENTGRDPGLWLLVKKLRDPGRMSGGGVTRGHRVHPFAPNSEIA